MKKLLFLAGIALFFAGCAKDLGEDNKADESLNGGYILRATTSESESANVRSAGEDSGWEVLPWGEASGSRAYLGAETSDGIQTLWEEDDYIDIFYMGDLHGRFSLVDGKQTPYGVFRGIRPFQNHYYYNAFCGSQYTSVYNGLSYNLVRQLSQASNGDTRHLRRNDLMFGYVQYHDDDLDNGEALTDQFVSMNMYHQFGLIELRITPTNYTGTLTLKKVTITNMYGGNSFIRTYNMEESSDQMLFNNIVEESMNAVSLKPTDGFTFAASGDDATYVCRLIAPTPYHYSAAPVKIILETNQGMFVVTDKSIPVGGFRGGKRYKSDIQADMSMAMDHWLAHAQRPNTVDATEKLVIVETPENLAWVAGVCRGDIYEHGIPQSGSYSAYNYFDGWTVRLTQDINLSGKEWIPIGFYIDFYTAGAFYGTFDGGGHTISGLTTTDPCEEGPSGLFGFAGGAIRNLTISSGSVAGHGSSGAFVGFGHACQIYNCHNTGCSVSATHDTNLVDWEQFMATALYLERNGAGGIIGCSFVGNVVACTNSASVSGLRFASGGIAGANGNGLIMVCRNSGSVVSGGIVGENYGGEVASCINAGPVTGTSTYYTGALAGSYEGGWLHTCYWKTGTAPVTNRAIGSQEGAVTVRDGGTFASNAELNDLVPTINVPILLNTGLYGYYTRTEGWRWKANDLNPDDYPTLFNDFW